MQAHRIRQETSKVLKKSVDVSGRLLATISEKSCNRWWQETGNLKSNWKARWGQEKDKRSRELESSESQLICCTKRRMSSKRKLFAGVMDINVTGIRKQTSKSKPCTVLSRRVSGFMDQGELVVASALTYARFLTLSSISLQLSNWGYMDWIDRQKIPWIMKFEEFWSTILYVNWLGAVFLSRQYWPTSPDLNARTERILSTFTDDIKWEKQPTRWKAGSAFRRISANWRKKPEVTLLSYTNTKIKYPAFGKKKIIYSIRAAHCTSSSSAEKDLEILGDCKFNKSQHP